MLMKEGLGPAAIERIGGSLARTVPGFPRKRFIAQAMDGIADLELKARVHHLVAVLHDFLPADFEEAANILIRLKANWIPADAGDNMGGFAAWPILDYAGTYGLGHPETALAVLKELTPLFSAEFAIRSFFIQHRELTLRTVQDWCTDPNEHVRRLVSEGSRPRLPWGQRLPQFIKDPAPVLQLLEKLKDDPSEYVRRSVANNLNDISKDHPDRVVALCKRWRESATSERQWIIRRATRTLVKAGHADVFGLLGHTENPRLELHSLAVEPADIRLGESIEFTCTLRSTSSTPQTIVIDYAIHHVKANGNTTPKVFKYRTLEIKPGETVELSKRHAIKPITTRKYHPGEHAVEILINGKTFGKARFMLCVAG